MHGLKILAGRLKGKTIIPCDKAVRPTLTRHRERLFDWLAPFTMGACVLDLCAGSGILGFEALSRGAVKLVSVDRSLPCIRRLHQSSCALGEQKSHVIIQKDLHAFLASHSPITPFNIVFFDPPFENLELYSKVLRHLCTSSWLSPGALIYCESSLLWTGIGRSSDLSLDLIKEKTLARVVMRLYQHF